MSMQTGDQLNPLEMQNSGARVPAIRLVKSNPKAAALVSKMVVDQRAQKYVDAMDAQGAGMNLANLRTTSHDGMQNVNDAETIRQLLSDTDLAAAILVSVILSPKDMVGVEVGYKAELTHWRLPHETNSTMVNAVRKYFDEVYKIKPRLPTMLEDILFKRGCYPVAVLPENAVDDLIHGNGSISMESMTLKTLLKSSGQIESLGILGPIDKDLARRERGYKNGVGLALEHLLTHQPDKDWNNEVVVQLPEVEYTNGKEKKKLAAETFNTYITVTDNVSILKMPQLSGKIRSQKIHKILGRSSALSAESIAQRVVNPVEPNAYLTKNAVTARVYHRPNTSQTVVREIQTQVKLKRRSIGMPLEIHFPSESVIPVHVPNQPSKQIGFFVLLDAEGNPVNRGTGINHYQQLSMNLQNNSFASSMIQRAGLAMSDNSNLLTQNSTYATITRMYGQMVERDLLQRLKNGLVGNNVSIAGQEEIYSLMLARSLSNQHTQVLYVPVEYMTYMAFEYNTNGTGRSLLENTKIIDSMQANMLVGTIMGALRNAIGRTHVDLKLDPDTPDPWKAIEQTMGEIMRVNSNGFPLGTINPLDIKDGLQRSAFEFTFSGHPRLPDMEVNFSEKNSNYQPPDSKIMEDLRKRRLMSFWLTPEMVDAAVGADFAKSVAQNSTLLSKRAMMIQNEFTPQVSAHLRKHAINSADLIDELIDIVNGNFEDILKEFKEDEEIEMFDGVKVTKNDLKANAAVKGQFIRELIEDFIGGFSLTLPEPDTTKVENLGELYSKQSQLIDDALKAWISTDMLDESIVGAEMANHVNVIFQQVKAYMLRQWQIKNGMLPELAQLTAKGDDGEVELDISEIQADHNKAMMEVIMKILVANQKQKEKNEKALKKAGVEESSNTFGSSGDSGGYGGDDSSGSGDGGFNLDGGDFSFDMDGDGAGSGTDDGTGSGEGEGADNSTDTPPDDSSSADIASTDEEKDADTSASDSDNKEEPEEAPPASEDDEEDNKK